MKKLTGFALVLLIAAAVGGCATTPPEEDPVLIKLDDIDTVLPIQIEYT